MPIIKSYRNLDVYQVAFEASIIIHNLSKQFPKDEQFSITSQIRRSSKSICANIAEGFVKQSQSKAEFKRYLYIAAGSASEVTVWLDYCLRLNYISEKDFIGLEKEYVRIESMLNVFISKIK
jgi:four helix bundle protein